ncbi:hypothetical protein LguiB_010819 [Lonicera macranthoides]
MKDLSNKLPRGKVKNPRSSTEVDLKPYSIRENLDKGSSVNNFGSDINLEKLMLLNILGFVAIAADFRISRGMLAPEREKIGLFVARTDNMDTSSLYYHAAGSKDKGPQLPTDLTPMLICGTNFLQVVGNFNDELDQGGLIGGVLLVSNRTTVYSSSSRPQSVPHKTSLNSNTAQSSNSPRNTVTQNLHPLTSSHAMHIPGCSTIKQNVLLIRHQNTRGRPSGRMRGSLKGEAYTAALCRFMRQAAQPADRELPRLLPPYIVFRVRSRAVLLTSLTE